MTVTFENIFTFAFAIKKSSSDWFIALAASTLIGTLFARFSPATNNSEF